MDEPKNIKNKLTNSAFKQQQLPAWQPILTADTVLPMFFLIGILFIPIGVGLLLSSNQVQEKVIDYTHCLSNSNVTCADLIALNVVTYCVCDIKFSLTEDFLRDVYIYYSLTNYYQNHRRYVKSRDDSQLYGSKSLSQDCEPFAYKQINGRSLPIAPCGAIANSLFNDTFLIYEVNESHKYRNLYLSSSERLINLLRTGIAWATDKGSKFRNPFGTNLKEAFKDYTNPPNWRNKQIWQMDEYKPNNNGYLNEAFIVWMRTAAFPSFRKLYGRIDHSSSANYHISLPKGIYKLKINYSYPVIAFGGTKRVIISNASWLGGKNPFLGIAYIVIGKICLVLSAVFLLIDKKFGKSKTYMIALTTKTPYLETST